MRFRRSPDAALTIHGSYDEEALAQILAGEHADVLFFPAQVPETYSYTLSLALATRTPIVASAIGAFTERLAGRAQTRLVPWDATAEQWNAALLERGARRSSRLAGGSCRPDTRNIMMDPDRYVALYLAPLPSHKRARPNASPFLRSNRGISTRRRRSTICR